MKGFQKVMMHVLFFACFSIVISAFVVSFIRWQRREMNKTADTTMRHWKNVWIQEAEALFMRLNSEDSLRRSQKSED